MSIRENYEKLGVEKYYKENASTYENPHELIIKDHLDILLKSKDIVNGRILDLCSGTGQVSNHLKTNGLNDIIGCDPFTFSEYTIRTGYECFKYNFLDIANGKMNEERFDIIICSFAMHLCEKTVLPNLLFNLSLMTDKLIVISPNKKPEINLYWKEQKNIIKDKVRTRVFIKNQ